MGHFPGTNVHKFPFLEFSPKSLQTESKISLRPI